MASGKSLQLRNIVRPAGKVLHKASQLDHKTDDGRWWVKNFPAARSSDRAERKAGQLAKRRAAKARKQAQERH